MVVYKNPHLIIRPIDDGFVTVVNTYSTDGLKLLNSTQFSIFEKIDGRNTVENIANLTGLNPSNLQEILKSWEKKQIINFTGVFKEPKWETEHPKSMNLWIHTTNKCNLGCDYCYISTLQTTGGMSEEVIQQLGKKLLETAISRKLKSVKIRLSGGEPLLQFKKWKKFIIDTQEVFKENNISFSVAFLTNLTYLTEEIILFAKEHKIGFGVSIDGYSEYHDLTRKYHNGKGSFDKVHENLTELIRHGIKPSISTVVSQKNMEGLYALTEYLIDLNLHFRYSIVHDEPIDRNRLSKILTQCYDLMESAIYQQDFAFSQKHKLCDLKTSEIFSQTCSSGLNGGAVYVDGGLYFCHVKFGDNDISGNIFDEQDLLSIIAKKQHYIGERSEDCMTCNYKYVCTSGCPMYRINGKDASCDLYHEQMPRVYELMGRERIHKLKKIVNTTS